MVKFIKLCIITLLTEAEAWCSQPLDSAPTTNKSLITVSLQMVSGTAGGGHGTLGMTLWAWELHDHYKVSHHYPDHGTISTGPH